MAGIITRADMIEEMGKGGFFSIEFVTADVARKKGGKLLAYTNACRLSSEAPDYVGTKKKGHGRGYRRVQPGNETIKLHLPAEPKQSDRIRRVHLYLITKFNGREVV